MNKLSIVIILLLASTLVVVVSPTVEAKKSKSGSPEYQAGYRAGVLQADSDVSANKGVSANNVTCPPDSTADSCSGYKKGYSDEAIDQLD
jgi:hypothetical protein